MSERRLIYFSDPMCSWCYGFAPAIDAVVARFGAELPIRLVMGGLRPGTTEPMSFEAKTQMAQYWTAVEEASGQPFDAGVIQIDGFVYDTDPAARATVIARRRGQAVGLAFLHAAQSAFYARGLDVTSPDVLADLADHVGLDRAAFLDDLASEAAKEETWRDYALSQNAGVTGFPTLIAGPREDGAYMPVTRGYDSPDRVVAALEAWLAA